MRHPTVSHWRNKRRASVNSWCHYRYLDNIAFSSTLVVTDAEKLAAPELEPAFEYLFRLESVHEDVISALRITQINDRQLCVARVSSNLQRKASVYRLRQWRFHSQARVVLSDQSLDSGQSSDRE